KFVVLISFEAGNRDSQIVFAERQLRHGVVAGIRTGGRIDLSGVYVSERDGSIWNSGSGLVHNRSRDCGQTVWPKPAEADKRNTATCAIRFMKTPVLPCSVAPQKCMHFQRQSCEYMTATQL